MKKYLKIIVALVLPYFLFSCNNEMEEYFEDSASQRMEKAIDKYQTVLKGSQHGWLLQYLPDKKQSYGAYNYVIKFKENDECVVWSELMEDFAKPDTSSYTVRPNGGPLLSFYTYNATLMKDFANPGWQNPKAKGGDYEFMIMKVSNDTVYLKGNLSGNDMFMTKLKKPFGTYLEEAKEISLALERNNIKEIQINGKKVEFIRNSRVIILKDKKGNEIKYPYVFTNKGIRFITPMDAGGTAVSELLFDNTGENDMFKSKDGKISITLYFPAPLDFVTHRWLMFANGNDPVLKCSDNIIKVFNSVYEKNIDAIVGVTMELEPMLTFGYQRREQRIALRIISWTDTSHKYGFGLGYDIEFYGKKSAPNELYMDYLQKGFGIASLKHYFPLRDIIINNAPYIVEDTDNPKIKKLTSKKDANTWFFFEQIRI